LTCFCKMIIRLMVCCSSFHFMTKYFENQNENT
jgi:hypothetical protein